MREIDAERVPIDDGVTAGGFVIDADALREFDSDPLRVSDELRLCVCVLEVDTVDVVVLETVGVDVLEWLPLRVAVLDPVGVCVLEVDSVSVSCVTFSEDGS